MAGKFPNKDEVIRLMKDGWELGSYDDGVNLQQGGIGRGGPVRTVHRNTLYALQDAGLIAVVRRQFPASIWGLTEKGKV